MSSYKYNPAHAATLDTILDNQTGGTAVTRYKQGNTDLGALYKVYTHGYKKYFKLSETTTLNECKYKFNGTPLTEILLSDISNYFTLTGTYVNDISAVNTETNKYNYAYKFTGDGTQATMGGTTTSVAQASSGSIKFINNTRVRVVAIGGGGGGGNWMAELSEAGGGGGAGGMLDVIIDCIAGVTYNITIGIGGGVLSTYIAQAGFPTTVVSNSGTYPLTLTAPGGGRGGCYRAYTGGNGGCGGGACGYGATFYGGTVTTTTASGYASTTAQYAIYEISPISNVTIGSLTTTGTSGLVALSGFSGGSADRYCSGGGGGGIGGAGGNVSRNGGFSLGGAGGIGKTIFNTAVGGGGGGGSGTGGVASVPGTGSFGGGNGIYYNNILDHALANGHPNTGGGGGGAPNSPNTYGGVGGTGVCWICF